MRLTVNGRALELPAARTVADVVRAVSDAPEGRGLAVALSGEVVPRAAWERTTLSEGAALEVVAAVQGG